MKQDLMLMVVVFLIGYIFQEMMNRCQIIEGIDGDNCDNITCKSDEICIGPPYECIPKMYSQRSPKPGLSDFELYFSEIDVTYVNNATIKTPWIDQQHPPFSKTCLLAFNNFGLTGSKYNNCLLDNLEGKKSSTQEKINYLKTKIEAPDAYRDPDSIKFHSNQVNILLDSANADITFITDTLKNYPRDCLLLTTEQDPYRREVEDDCPAYDNHIFNTHPTHCIYAINHRGFVKPGEDIFGPTPPPYAINHRGSVKPGEDILDPTPPPICSYDHMNNMYELYLEKINDEKA